VSIGIDREATLHCNQVRRNPGWVLRPARDIEAAKLCGPQIYVNLGIVVEIEEMGIDESSDMRDYLCVDVLQPRYRETHRWTVGDVLV